MQSTVRRSYLFSQSYLFRSLLLLLLLHSLGIAALNAIRRRSGREFQALVAV